MILLLLASVLLYGLSAYAANIPGLSIKWYSAGKSRIFSTKIKVKNGTNKKIKVDEDIVIRDYDDEESYLWIGSVKSYLDGTSMIIFNANKGATIKKGKSKTINYDGDGFVLKLNSNSYFLLNLKAGSKKYTYYYYPMRRNGYIAKGWKIE